MSLCRIVTSQNTAFDFLSSMLYIFFAVIKKTRHPDADHKCIPQLQATFKVIKLNLIDDQIDDHIS